MDHGFVSVPYDWFIIGTEKYKFWTSYGFGLDQKKAKAGNTTIATNQPRKWIFY